MDQASANRAFVRADINYSLCGPSGFRTPDTHSRCWFFDVPQARNTDEGWTELLNRLFYDNNLRMRRREPGDENWLNVETFTRSPVDVAAMLASDGKSWNAFPWMEADRSKVWEVSPIYFVDDGGRYDVLAGTDYTELIMLRLLQAGKVDQATYVKLFDRIYPPKDKPSPGQIMYDDRVNRMNNLVSVRQAPYYQKPPGQKPWVSGPVDLASAGG